MAGGGGGLSPIARVLGQMRSETQGPQGAEFTPMESNPYTPQLSSRQVANPYSQPSALNQQMAAQRNAAQFNPYAQGLQNLYSMFNAPRQMMPMPQYTVPGLSYRPNMQSGQEVLRRVAPSVAEQQRRQAIEDARRAAEEAAAQGGEFDPYYGSYSNPGG